MKPILTLALLLLQQATFLLAQRPSHFSLDGNLPAWNRLQSDTVKSRTYYAYQCDEHHVFDPLDRMFRGMAIANYTPQGKLKQIRFGYVGSHFVKASDEGIVTLRRMGKWQESSNGIWEWTCRKNCGELPISIILDEASRRLTVTRSDGSCRALEWDDR